MTNMATSLTALLLLLVLIPHSSTRIRSSSEEQFLRSLDERDTVFYFGSSLADSVPEFQLVSLACPSTELHAEPWQCSLETQRGVFLLGVREGHLPLSCPPGEESVLSATLGIWGGEPAMCCGYPRVLHPLSSEGFLSICSGKMRGLLALGTERFYIQPVLQTHVHLTVDPGQDPAWTGDPHMVFLLPPPDPASPGFLLTPTHAHSEGRRERRSAGVPDVTHLELLVVVGPDVQQVHRQDTERYILTNLNIASELLRDKTLGANMRVHLVRMIILSEPEPEIRLSANITSSLRSVCEWGHRVNPSNDTDPLHADVLLYITRFDLVLPNGNNQVRGVAQLGGACSSDWNCVITEDTGFDLGITIAHEIGHSFGINHDGMDNTCGRSGFMMASDGGYNSVDLTWSACSRQQLHTFFREGKAECVKDLPVLEGSLQDWKPGLYYGVDDQCRIAFGNTARACSFSNPDLPVCRVLSCHVIPGDKSSCKRLLVPLLDGTECAPNQWCLKGLCVSPEDVGSSAVVHGSWSSWSELSTCSRSCGGGVQHRTRFCNNPRPAFGGRDCEGKDTEAGLCHQQACESTQLDFMAKQCSLTDPQPLSLSPGTSNLYTWIPALGFVTGDEQCKFMCQSEGENFIVSRGSQFVDGTRCEPDHQAPLGSTPACLRGACQLFGCDGVLHSGKVEDMCGVCGGNGSSCSLVSQSYTGGQAREYATFLTLPLNATQVHVVNEAPVFTHMAVLVAGQYVVSGHGSMSMNVTHPSVLDDQRLEYRIYLTSDLLPYMEELKLPGPIREETHIQVYRKYGKEYGEQTSPNITYRYYSPGPSPDAGSAKLPRGSWASVPTPCSVTCSSGVQKHVYVCVDGDTREHLDERFCEKAPPTSPQQTACLLPACPASWEMGEFGPCSAPCGGGEAVRPVRCVQRQGGDLVQVPLAECPPDAPATTDSCNLQPCPARWQVSTPGECSAVCGPGEARRVVTCVRSEGGQDSEVDPSLCPQDLQPPDSEPCVVDVCPVGWESKGESLPTLKKTPGLLPRSGPPRPVYVWSPVIGQCSKTCGNGTLLVWFSCVDHQTRQAAPEMHCESSNKPAPRSATCNSSPCPPTWHYKEGACSVTCGGGVATRVLYCSRQGEEEGEEEVVEDAECSASPKPTGVVSCNTNSCPARWRVQKTGACSVTCGLGVAQRSVTCVQFTQGRDGEVGEEACGVSGVKPATAVPCLLQLCTFTWDAKAWSQCSVSCGYGVQSRAVWCTGPSTLQPLNPMLCMHRPKPITIQGCRLEDCPQRPTHLPLATSPPPLMRSKSAAPKTAPAVTGSEETPFLAPPPLNPTVTPRDPATTTPLPSHPSETTPPPTPSSTPKTSVCGQLLLQDSGTVDLTQVTGRCILSIGRPLDELIHIKVESSGLNCKKKEYVTFYDRLALNRKCGPVEGSVLTTRTNVLLVRQNLVTPGNGVLLTYSSQKNSRRSLDQGSCDVQLFGPGGIFENPTTPSVSDSHTCRVLINAPPSVKIRIQAQSIELPGNASSSQNTFIMIRDVDVLKTNVFTGQQLFLWLSSGSMAEIEFHGDYLRTPRSFKAEYSFILP